MKAGWKEKQVGDILQLEYGKPLEDKLRKTDGLYPVYGANGEKSRTNKFYFDKPSIIVGRKGSAGEINLTEAKFWPLDVTYFVTFDDRQSNLRFLFYMLTTLELPRLAKGVKPGINRNEVYSMPVLLPPLPEQQRIVAILDEAFAGIATAKAHTEKNLKNARALFDSQLEAIFENAWETYKTVSLSDIAIDITDGDHMPPPKSSDGVPFITISNINKDTHKVDFSDTFMVPLEYFRKLKPNKRPRKGDLLYTVTGSFGVPVIVDDDHDFCFQRHIGLIRPRPETDSSWLFYLLLSPQVFKQAEEGATGTAQKTVSLTVLRNFSVPNVPPLLQRLDALTLDVLSTETQRIEALYRQKLAALDELKKALLHQAFAGDLVDADPNNEAILVETTQDQPTLPTETRLSVPRTVRTRSSKIEINVLKRKDVAQTHLTDLLKEKGQLTPEELFAASQLDVDDFYAQLKAEAEAKHLFEIVSGQLARNRVLKAVE